MVRGSGRGGALGVVGGRCGVVAGVSGEPGAISVRFAGQLTRDLDDKGLRNTLLRLLVTEVKPRRRSLACACAGGSGACAYWRC